jgi:vacuolar iron transporter family protein
MKKQVHSRAYLSLTRYSFGSTSAIVTSLAFIISLSNSLDPRLSIVGSLLVIAIADNIADSFGIEVFQESELKKTSIIRLSTLTNFLTRFLVILVFIAFVLLLPMEYALTLSVIWGLALIALLSYFIAREKNASVARTVASHIAVVLVVVLVSYSLREWIITVFTGL